MSGDDVVERAAALAEDLLFPRALATDAADVLPASNLDALADLGLYGVFVPSELGGLGVDFPTMCTLVETLASGCLTTTLVWVQHFGLLGSLLGGPDHLRDAWLADACRGERRGGIAFGGLLPGPPVLTATPVAGADGEDAGGWRIDGFAPWVSGWGRIDLLHVAARDPGDTVVQVDDELAARRAALDAADAGAMAAARAAASELALRAAAALAVHAGSRSVRTDDHAQRLLREAMFLLVFGSRQPIKDSLLATLTRR